MAPSHPSGAVRLAVNGPRATITIDNPAKRNALDLGMTESLRDAAFEIHGNDNIRVVVLTGAGDLFSSGGDFDAMAAAPEIVSSVEAMERTFDAAIEWLNAIAVPVLASIRGACMGGAVQIALTADLRIAATDLRMAIPAVSLGLVYPLDAIAKMTALAGGPATKRILLCSETIDAGEALRLRLVDEVVPAADLSSRIEMLAARIEGQPHETARLYKRIIDQFALAEIPDWAKVARRSANTAPELIERMRALKEKRARR